MDPLNPVDYKTPNSLASIWSMMLPGLGQMMKGQIMAGLIWAFLVAGGYYAFFWPGIILHTLCILDAAFIKGEESFLSLSNWKRRLSFLGTVAAMVAYVFLRNGI